MFTLLQASARKRPIIAALRRCFSIASLLLAGLTHAQTPLTLDGAIALAQQRSGRIVAQDAAAISAREMAVAAGQRPDPVLTLALTNLPVTGPNRYSLGADFMTMRSIGVMQELTREDKRKARAARFERQADTALAGRASALAELRLDTTLAWLERHFLERQMVMQQALRVETTLQIETADTAFRTGRGNQADLFAARTAVAWNDDMLAQTRRDIATAQTRLARWVGQDAAAQPLADLPQALPSELADDALEQRVARHPRIMLALRAQDAAQADVDVARSNLRTDWTMELMFSQRGPRFSNMASINFSVPLQWDQDKRQNRELAARMAQSEQLRSEREEIAREQLALARGTLQSWQHNRQRLQHFDQTLQPLAAERSRAALATYRGGSGTLDVVLQARRSELETALQRLALEQENARLQAQLDYLIPAQDDTPAPSETQR